MRSSFVSSENTCCVGHQISTARSHHGAPASPNNNSSSYYSVSPYRSDFEEQKYVLGIHGAADICATREPSSAGSSQTTSPNVDNGVPFLSGLSPTDGNHYPALNSFALCHHFSSPYSNKFECTPNRRFSTPVHENRVSNPFAQPDLTSLPALQRRMSLPIYSAASSSFSALPPGLPSYESGVLPGCNDWSLVSVIPEEVEAIWKESESGQSTSDEAEAQLNAATNALAELSPELEAKIPHDVNGNLLSVGSICHCTGNCKPCVFAHHPTKPCQNGARCLFCHFPHAPKKRCRVSKKKRLAARAMVTASPCNNAMDMRRASDGGFMPAYPSGGPRRW